jgi:hypothetical protein
VPPSSKLTFDHGELMPKHVAILGLSRTVQILFVKVFGSLFYDAFSVTRRYSVDTMLI